MNRSNTISRTPSGFTLIELLITVSIMALMASMILFALYSAQESAREAKTKATIAKLDSIIKASWDAYLTRRTSINIQDEPSHDLNGDGLIDPTKTFIDLNGNMVADSGEYFDYNGNSMQDPQEMGEYYDTNSNGTWDSFNAATRARMQLDALRDLMRLEHPDRWTDIIDPPVTPINALYPAVVIARPWVSQTYFRRYQTANSANPNNPTGQFASSECLFLIVMSAVAEDADIRDLFRADEIKDTDDDGFPEFVDGWGQPIKFLRWPAGFQDSEFQIAANNVIASSTGTGSATLTGRGLNGQAGSYIGGAIFNLVTPPSQTKAMLDPNNVARILTYTPTGPGAANITYTGGSGTTISGPVAVTFPDPSDPLRQSNVSTPPFALYPLIYSAGPNKCFGVMADINNTVINNIPAGMHYAVAGTASTPFSVNPFKPGVDATNSNLNSLIGNERDDPQEPNFVPSAWTDNIHNHLFNAR